jgi:hypothetical protein
MVLLGNVPLLQQFQVQALRLGIVFKSAAIKGRAVAVVASFLTCGLEELPLFDANGGAHLLNWAACVAVKDNALVALVNGEAGAGVVMRRTEPSCVGLIPIEQSPDFGKDEALAVFGCCIHT